MNLTDKKEIINFFLSEGYQLDESALTFLSDDKSKIYEHLEYLKTTQTGKTTLTSNDFKKDHSNIDWGITILKTPQQKPQISTNELLIILNKRYDFFKNLLQNRIELVNLTSINKIGKMQKFSLVVLLRDIVSETSSLVVEDRTGFTQLFVEDKQQLKNLVEDEVVGLNCKQENERIVATGIIQPNIQIKKEITKLKNNVNCFFMSDKLLTNRNLKALLQLTGNHDNCHLFVFAETMMSGEARDVFTELPVTKTVITKNLTNEAGIISIIQTPSMVKINEMVLFLSLGSFLSKYSTDSTTTEATLLNLIKKRHLDPKLDIRQTLFINDPYLLDEMPDIIVIDTPGNPTSVTYKGITILTTGDVSLQPTVWKINLQTRETIKINLT